MTELASEIPFSQLFYNAFTRLMQTMGMPINPDEIERLNKACADLSVTIRSQCLKDATEIMKAGLGVLSEEIESLKKEIEKRQAKKEKQ